MADTPTEPRAVALEELPDLREKTERVSRFLQQRLRRQLEALRPLFAPARLFGRYAGGGVKGDVVGADETWIQLQDRYRAVCGKPYGIAPDIEVSTLEGIDGRLEVYPWEYPLELGGEKDRKAITVTAPLRWIVGYRTAYSPAELRQVLLPGGARKTDQIRQFLISTLALAALLEKNPGLQQLLGDLRYQVGGKAAPGLGELRLVTFDTGIQTFRPADSTVLAATRLSGVHAFVELIEASSVAAIKDSIRDELLALLE